MFSGLRKYYLTVKISWENAFVYRASIIMWRLRSFLSTLMSLTVWSVIFTHQSAAFNYQRKEMIAYVFLVSILHNLLLTTSLHNLAGTIYSGQLSFDMLKPLNIVAYLGAQDLADKLKGFFFVIIEASVLYAIFNPVISWPSWQHGLVFTVWALLGAILYFIINILFGTMGFWSPHSWGPKFLFFMFLDFTAGKLYPLDILPPIIRQIVYLTPFPYLSYAQVQIFLGRLSWAEIGLQSLSILAWILGLSLVTRIIWRKGLKSYTAMGQ